MARSSVTNGDMKDRCERTEQAVAESRQGVVPQLGGWAAD
jgi:hypothetical protein